jgi:Mg2+-importing ATPase
MTPAAPPLAESARLAGEDLLARLASAPSGLTEHEAARRLAVSGPNEIAVERPTPWWRRLLGIFANPLVLLLTILLLVALATGDARAAMVMGLMIVIGVSLQFVRESRADTAAATLRAMIRVTATVLREGASRTVPLREVVPGDVVALVAGDLVPADLRLLAARDLFVNQSRLTGESLPVEKLAAPAGPDAAAEPLASPNLCFLGASVLSGTATGLVLATGPATYLGGMAHSLAQPEPPTAFDRGVTRFTWLMIGFIAVMSPLVFLINGLTKHDWREAFFFALAVAVGLTPEMLPMIVSVCLSQGALAMARRRVIVKRLDAIQNVGAMDVLCTDKTGTLTMDTVILERHCDATGAETEDVLLAGILISHFQTGLRSVLDDAILKHLPRHAGLSLAGYHKLDELPFDFQRRIMSVVVEAPDGSHRLIAKGAPEEVLKRCTRYQANGSLHPVEPGLHDSLHEMYDALSADGFRVLAVASRQLEVGVAGTVYSRAHEADLVFVGYLAFLDPPKETAAPAVEALRASGVQVKVLTGDNALVARKICGYVGIAAERVMTGAEVEGLGDVELRDAVESATVFARLAPADKPRVIRALQQRGHVVGFLGDGINDALALRAADVGLSVDTAVDVAKEAADVILLEKNLLVLRDGVLEGRKVFSNVIKYVRMGASSSFGNMFSVLGASAWLPFVPMAPLQVLTNNLLYDISQVPIPTDNVDAEQIAKPRPWAIGEIGRYILLIGPLSSIFDYTTFLALFFVFGANTPAHAALFQTGWFVESLMTQTLIVHVIRTNRIPFLQSSASWPLVATTVAIMAIGAWLPVSPLAPALGFVAPPARFWPLLLATLLGYVILTTVVKRVLHRRGWIA